MTDLVRVTILDTATGEHRSILEAFEWSDEPASSPDGSLYGCECDRAFLFARAGGTDADAADDDGRYILRIEDPHTGAELYADEGWSKRSTPDLVAHP